MVRPGRARALTLCLAVQACGGGGGSNDAGGQGGAGGQTTGITNAGADTKADVGNGDGPSGDASGTVDSGPAVVPGRFVDVAACSEQTLFLDDNGVVWGAVQGPARGMLAGATARAR
jgi:hypothetical protein